MKTLLIAPTLMVAALLLPPVASGAGYPVVDTGQVNFYNNNAQIKAPALGAPFYGEDAQFAGLQPRYTLSTDGSTVVDGVTGLTWMRGPNITRTKPVKSDKKSYAQIQAWVASVNAKKYGSYSDWRLPTIKELYSLINFTGTDPSGYSFTNLAVLTPFIDTRYFLFGYGQTSLGERLIDAQYASSTLFVTSTVRSGTPKLFGVNMADGRIKGYDLVMPGRTMLFFVQLVRGPTGYGANLFTDNGDGTISDSATGLMWAKADSGSALNWQDALVWVQQQNQAKALGHSDWRLPNAKELQSLVNYANAPEFNGKPAIDTNYFTCTTIINENGDADYPYYWASTTHVGISNSGLMGGEAVYLAFGRALGWPSNGWVDIHGAGAQRADPKVGPPFHFGTPHSVTRNGHTYTGVSFGPEGGAIRGLNFVRLVRTSGS